MTTDPIHALLTRWREMLTQFDAGSDRLSGAEAGQLSECADELEAALAALPPTLTQEDFDDIVDAIDSTVAIGRARYLELFEKLNVLAHHPASHPARQTEPADLMTAHIAQRRALFDAITPRDEKAATVKFARLNELAQMEEAIAWSLPTGRAPEEPRR